MSSIWAPMLLTTIGATLAAIHWRDSLRAWRSGGWDVREGEILEIGTHFGTVMIGRVGARLAAHSAVRYRYTVPDPVARVGYEREGNRFRFGPVTTREAIRFAQQHPVGSRVAVRVNPRNFNESVLMPGATFLGTFGSISGAVILVVGMYWLGATLTSVSIQ